MDALTMLAQAADTNVTPNLSNALIIYGPLGIFFTGALLLARKYIPKILDAYIESVDSGRTSTVKVAEAVKALTEEFSTIAANTTTLAGVHKQQADALTLLAEQSHAHTDPHGHPNYSGHVFSTVHTNTALGFLARAKLLETDHPEARLLIEQAIAALQRPPKQ